ncbi:MAG: ABC transporter permease [Cumulibacter sp.]
MRITYLLRRIARGVIVLWLVHLMTFALVRLIPGDPAEVIGGDQATAEQVEAIREGLGLNDPLLMQYLNSVSSALRGDLGESLFSGIPVTQLLIDAAPPSISIALLALLFASLIGVTFGSIAGLTHGRWIDRAVTTVASLGIAMPNFWVGMVLVSIFSITLGWLPSTSYVPLSDGFGRWISHLILPALALATAVAAEVARHTRGGVIDVLGQPYIRAARSRGSSGTNLVRRHVGRNAAIPVVTVIGLTSGTLLGGTVIVETVFAISGLGNLAIGSVLSRDYPVIQGYVLLTAFIVVVVNIVVDFSYGLINPKVRAQ